MSHLHTEPRSPHTAPHSAKGAGVRAAPRAGAQLRCQASPCRPPRSQATERPRASNHALATPPRGGCRAWESVSRQEARMPSAARSSREAPGPCGCLIFQESTVRAPLNQVNTESRVFGKSPRETTLDSSQFRAHSLSPTEEARLETRQRSKPAGWLTQPAAAVHPGTS